MGLRAMGGSDTGNAVGSGTTILSRTVARGALATNPVEHGTQARNAGHGNVDQVRSALRKSVYGLGEKFGHETKQAYCG